MLPTQDKAGAAYQGIGSKARRQPGGTFLTGVATATAYSVRPFPHAPGAACSGRDTRRRSYTSARPPSFGPAQRSGHMWASRASPRLPAAPPLPVPTIKAVSEGQRGAPHELAGDPPIRPIRPSPIDPFGTTAESRP